MSNVKVKSNIVGKKATRIFQVETMHVLANNVLESAGPMGSLTKIIKRMASEASPNSQEPISSYTKDGHTILANIDISDSGLLCKSCKYDLFDITTNVKKKVGDGSTGATVLADIIFEKLVEYESNHSFAPRLISKKFKKAIDIVIDKIKEKSKEFTPEDAYNIAYISSNGNEEVSTVIRDIYKEFGNEVYIDVEISPDKNHAIKEIDGMSLNVGWNNPSYANTSKGNCVLSNPRIYYFKSNIDTPDQIELFAKIILNNIITPYSTDPRKAIPTVIVTPGLGVDAEPIMNQIFSLLRQYSRPDLLGMKPPIAMITDTFEEGSTDDIVRMCDCPVIKKYINPDTMMKDRENGNAPTVETIVDWYGTAQQVAVDNVSTKFINPALMHTTKGEERIIKAKAEGTYNENNWESLADDNEIVLSSTYLGFISSLEAVYEQEKKNKATIDILADLQKRIYSLKSKVVEYQIGGISPRDRDAVKDSVTDAVKNCRSASKYGIGYGCLMEAFFACKELEGKCIDDEMTNDFLEIIQYSVNAYIKKLYIMSLGLSDEKAMEYLSKNDRENGIVDLSDGSISTKILSSIETDIVILDSIYRIINLMISTSQTAIPDSLLDVYTDFIK